MTERISAKNILDALNPLYLRPVWSMDQKTPEIPLLQLTVVNGQFVSSPPLPTTSRISSRLTPITGCTGDAAMHARQGEGRTTREIKTGRAEVQSPCHTPTCEKSVVGKVRGATNRPFPLARRRDILIAFRQFPMCTKHNVHIESCHCYQISMPKVTCRTSLPFIPRNPSPRLSPPICTLHSQGSQAGRT